MALTTVVLSRIPLESELQKENLRLDNKNLRLDNEIKAQTSKDIKKRLKSDEDIKKEIIDEVYNLIKKDYKILWHKSNFHKKVNHQLKISKVSTVLLDNNNKPVNEEKTVERKDFHKGILISDKLPYIEDENAIIDIIAPVIKKGKYSWKGYYNGESISFEMADTQFKDSIINKEVEFKNGTAIKCVLRQNRKIDENGLIKFSKSKVYSMPFMAKSGLLGKTNC